MSKILRFYDMKYKKSFESEDYEIVEKGGRNFAVTTAPSGVESWRVLPKNFEN
jgi:hypothetical protein